MLLALHVLLCYLLCVSCSRATCSACPLVHLALVLFALHALLRILLCRSCYLFRCARFRNLLCTCPRASCSAHAVCYLAAREVAIFPEEPFAVLSFFSKYLAFNPCLPFILLLHLKWNDVLNGSQMAGAYPHTTYSLGSCQLEKVRRTIKIKGRAPPSSPRTSMSARMRSLQLLQLRCFFQRALEMAEPL